MKTSARILVPLAMFAVAISLIWWRGPDWHLVRDTFTIVRWPWVVVAVALNLASVVVRALAWNTVIRQAIPSPRPGFKLVFSAFCVGLFANAVLPGRAGELARVAVLARRMPGRKGVWATLVGTVFAHRMFDLFPTVVLVIWVLSFAVLPHWAVMTLIVVLGIGVVLLGAAIFLSRGTARHQPRTFEDGLGRARVLLVRARIGLAVMRRPLAAAAASAFQCLGWFFQLLAVYAAMNAFRIYEPLVAAGLVLLLMNVVTVIPFWPGNIGLVQAAVAVSLAQYGVRYAKGFAFGIGLQLIEASVGIGIGTVFLAREGISYAMLRDIETASAHQRDELVEIDEAQEERAS
jgi:glycosyltransferase 2 family protein